MMSTMYRIQSRHLVLPLIMILILMLSACENPWRKDPTPTPTPVIDSDGDDISDINVSQTEAIKKVVEIEEVPIPNCGGGAEKSFSLATEETVREGIELGTAVTAGIAVSIPPTAKLQLEAQLQVSYKQDYSRAVSLSNEINFTTPAHTHEVHEIRWTEETFMSDISFMMNEELHQIPYTYRLTYPRPGETSPVDCPTPTHGSEGEWKSVRGSWNFGDDIVYGKGEIGFNKAYKTGPVLDELTYEVTLRKTSNNDGPIGLLIRYDEIDDSGYLFLVWPHGGYQFSALLGEERRRLAGEDNVSVVNQGNEWNKVKITAVGSRITISLNEVEVASLTDNTFPSGKVGLVIHGDSDQTAEFKNPILIER